MAARQRSISLEEDVADEVGSAAAESAAAETGLSINAWLSRGEADTSPIGPGLRGVAEWEAEAGKLSTVELAEGEALLDRLLSGKAGAAPR